MVESLTIVHTADWHVCDEFLKDATACLSYLTAQTQKIGPDLIVISGDIYNHRQIRQESLAARLAFETIRNLANIAPVVILVGTPSHDGLAPLLTAQINEDYPVMVSEKPEALILTVEKFGTTAEFYETVEDIPDTMEAVAFISTVPAFTKQYFQSVSDIETSDKEIAARLGAIFTHLGAEYRAWTKAEARTVPHVLMGHWTVGGSFVHPGQALTGLDIDIARSHIALANADIVCLGHIHAQQQMGSNIFYSGSLFATDFGEIEAKGFYCHYLELKEPDNHWEIRASEFLHTPSPLLIKVVSDLFAVKTEQTANVVLLQALKSIVPNPTAIIRHEIRVYQDMAHTIDEAMVRKTVAEHIGPREYQMNISRMPRPNVRSARVLHVETLRDKLKTRAEIINEPISESILLKADELEAYDRDELFNHVQKGVAHEN